MYVYVAKKVLFYFPGNAFSETFYLFFLIFSEKILEYSLYHFFCQNDSIKLQWLPFRNRQNLFYVVNKHVSRKTDR